MSPAHHFNPRSHEGSDAISFFKCFQNLRISIHAPTKGATPCIRSHLTFFSIFQSTLPRRERLNCTATRPNVESISIHAPTKGATVLIFLRLVNNQFQSTLPRRERRGVKYSTGLYVLNFNPRSHEGSDLLSPDPLSCQS